MGKESGWRQDGDWAVVRVPRVAPPKLGCVAGGGLEPACSERGFEGSPCHQVTYWLCDCPSYLMVLSKSPPNIVVHRRSIFTVLARLQSGRGLARGLGVPQAGSRNHRELCQLTRWGPSGSALRLPVVSPAGGFGVAWGCWGTGPREVRSHAAGPVFIRGEGG